MLQTFFTNLLSPYSINDYYNIYVKNSVEFAEFIRQRKISNTEEMVSLDFENLFKNVPTNETIYLIIKDLYCDNKLKTVTKITGNNMQKQLKICTQEAHFMCNSTVSFMNK